ncbi:MAG TPA: response regulator [Steroidobacteraceae bacterium]|nr:response regulator [Steroidobacteraceae bacterium]
MLTVLVVEDEFGVADVVVTALEDEGYRVLIAANGRQGMERLADTSPDLIILDFMMPIMDGAAMGKEVRAMPELADVPIVMTSAVGEAAVRERFADFQAFLRKPFRIQELLETVARLIGK